MFDSSARLSAESKLARTARDVPTLLVTSATTQLPPDLEKLGVQAIRAHDVGDALSQLKQGGIKSLMIEGGAGLAASFLGGGYVDRLTIFQAPVILGFGSLNAFSGVAGQDVDEAPRFRIIKSVQLEDDVVTTYSVARQ